MERLDRNDSQVQARIAVNVLNQLLSEALSINAMVQLDTKKSRACEEAQRRLKAKTAELKNIYLRANQDLGFLDQSLVPDDMRHLR